MQRCVIVVVSQPCGLAITPPPAASARRQRRYVSCTMSSASLIVPSIRYPIGDGEEERAALVQRLRGWRHNFTHR